MSILFQLHMYIFLNYIAFLYIIIKKNGINKILFINFEYNARINFFYKFYFEENSN